MSYELKEYLKAINSSKEKLMDGEDEMWEKKYPANENFLRLKIT